MNRDFQRYFVYMHQLDLLLSEKVAKGEKIKKGVFIKGKKVNELDLRVEVLLKGFKKAKLTPNEREKILSMKRDIYKKFG